MAKLARYFIQYFAPYRDAKIRRSLVCCRQFYTGFRCAVFRQPGGHRHQALRGSRFRSKYAPISSWSEKTLLHSIVVRQDVGTLVWWNIINLGCKEN